MSFRFGVYQLLQVSYLTLFLGQLGRIPIFSAGQKEAPLLANDIAVVLTLAVGGLLAYRRQKFHLNWPAGLALLFAMVGASSALLAVGRYGLSFFELAFSLAYLARWLGYFTLYVLVFNLLLPTELEGVWRGMERAVIAFACFGLFQSLFLPDFAQRVYPDAPLYTQWDPQGRRLVSTFLDPNLAGGLIVVILLVQLSRASYGVPVAIWKSVILLLALAFTLSRSSLLAFLAGWFFMVIMRGRVSLSWWRLALAAFPILALLFPVLLELAFLYRKLDFADPSLLSRFVSWQRAFSIWADHPFLGVGFNTYGFVQARESYGPLVQSSFGLDGGLLFIGVLTGAVGLVIFVAMLFRLGLEAYRVWMGHNLGSGERGLALGAASATVALLVHSLFVNSLLYPMLNHVLWILWGSVSLIYGTMTVAPSFSEEVKTPLLTGRRPSALA